MHIIAIIGENGVGKRTAASYLRRVYGFHEVTFTEMVKSTWKRSVLVTDIQNNEESSIVRFLGGVVVRIISQPNTFPKDIDEDIDANIAVVNVRDYKTCMYEQIDKIVQSI
jgi:ABC-type phosphate transport system ATPase subunit